MNAPPNVQHKENTLLKDKQCRANEYSWKNLELYAIYKVFVKNKPRDVSCELQKITKKRQEKNTGLDAEAALASVRVDTSALYT
jgi:hypothetical protein